MILRRKSNLTGAGKHEKYASAQGAEAYFLISIKTIHPLGAYWLTFQLRQQAPPVTRTVSALSQTLAFYRRTQYNYMQ